MTVFELHILNHDGQTFTQLCHSYEKAHWLLTQHIGGANVGGVAGEHDSSQWYITELSVI